MVYMYWCNIPGRLANMHVWRSRVHMDWQGPEQELPLGVLVSLSIDKLYTGRIQGDAKQ
jgi:hypothetical protein